MGDNPKVFISYAGEDWERFVRPFAERLRTKGVDAWVAVWEMLPGDKLVSKIFDEGLARSDAVIVILSKFSVDKPWVREELAHAKIREVEDKVRLIPVKIESCDVPNALRNNIWQDISDRSNYDRQFERIVNAIYGQHETPPLGPKPNYVRPDVLNIGELSRIDSIIFERACRIAIEQGHAVCISGDQLVNELAAQGISEDQIMETEEVLERRHYVKLQRVMGPPHAYNFSITKTGFDKFAQVGIPDYGKLCADVARMLVREEEQTNKSVAKKLNIPIRVVEHIFESLQDNGLINFDTDFGDGLNMYVYSVSPELRRKLEGNN